MLIDGKAVEEKELEANDFDQDNACKWSYTWNHQIPEFTTIAIPVAAILGLLFFFDYRKRRKGQ